MPVPRFGPGETPFGLTWTPQVLQTSCFHSQLWKPNANLLSKRYATLSLMTFISEGGQKSPSLSDTARTSAESPDLDFWLGEVDPC